MLAMAEHFPDVSMVLFTNRENDPVLKKDLSLFKNMSFELLDFAASNRYMRIIREQIELPGRARRAGVDVLWSLGYTAPFFVLVLRWLRFTTCSTRLIHRICHFRQG